MANEKMKPQSPEEIARATQEAALEQMRAMMGSIPGMPDMGDMQAQIMAQMQAAVPDLAEIQAQQAAMGTLGGVDAAAVAEAAQQAALAFEQAMYKFETHRALAVCDDYLRAANKRWSDASKAANKLEGEPANAAMTQALVDAFTELRVATMLMHGIVPAGCELICEYFDVDPVAFFSWDNIFASTDEFVESLGEKPGEHRVKPLPPRFDFFSKHESQY